MKLVVGDSNGFVGEELIRQALICPAITSIVALSRRETLGQPSSTKLQRFICDNFESYADSVKRELEDTDTSTRALADLRHNQDRPLRFIYISGHFAPHSPAEVPKQLPNNGLINYGLMRVREAESRVLAYAEHSKGSVRSCVAKPGHIEVPSWEKQMIPGLSIIDLREFAAALLDQVVNGFEKDTLLNGDMVQIGPRALGEEKSLNTILNLLIN
ncbi:hypothetical protein F5Y00DRAFT_264939 [Daldinia vernicosa]|uniref:uncharacterized protein n=1 Tax=Daldinia vernicosa TaxID=114800 RepID=UPI0020072840|nr:uncharacterized protein F5Y00DRAFT_264939 [Daldinia vernicosa]KAI0846045.1 hypothetical protein F5Y00DRAFT_264939 [Daldinia vernicosa]